MKAQKAGLAAAEETDFDVLWSLVCKTWDRQSKRPGFDRRLLQSIYEASRSRNAGKIVIVYDRHKKPYAGLLYVWAHDTAYFITSGADPEQRNRGATPLLYWEAMLDAAQVAERVNYCGSMNPAIELLLRGLGTVQTPYLMISKDQRPPLLKAAMSARNTLRELLRAVGLGRGSA